MRLIDADALYADLKESAKLAREWKEETQDEEIKIRAEQAFGTFCECALRVKNAPTIEANQVQHSQWSDTDIMNMKQCANCGEILRMRFDLKGNVYPYCFCPNCGSKMQGGAEDVT